MEKRIFEKFFTRPMSLLTAQYWYLGECDGLEKLTEGAMHFEPLFIYDGQGGVSCYYEMNNPKLYLAPLIEYFRQKPEAFPPLVKAYQQNISAIETLAKEPKVKDLKKIYQLIVKAWPMISVSVIVGRLVDDPQIKAIAQQAFDLRHSTDKIEYQAANILLSLAKLKIPEHQAEVDYLTFEEIMDPKKIDLQAIKARKNGYFYFNGQVFTGLTLDEFKNKYNLEFQEVTVSEEITEIKGQSAQLGKITGTVKIVASLADLNKVNEGDILVASMTTPDYLPALKKASGFITDEGGITCHAAIVARELKKPCIIGTKIATKALKDGDMVEVDADKGIVRIIK